MNIRMPSNAYMCFDLLSQITQKDTYPTDDIYEVIFNFTETDSPIKRFEILGFEGSNFICLTGSVLINAITALISAFFIYFLQRCAMKNLRMACGGIFVKMIPKLSSFAGIQRIFIEGYLEILISACLMYMGID